MIVELLSTFFGGPGIPSDPPGGLAPHSFLTFVLATFVIGIPAGLFAGGAFAVLMKFQNKANAKRRARIQEEIRNAALRRAEH